MQSSSIYDRFIPQRSLGTPVLFELGREKTSSYGEALRTALFPSVDFREPMLKIGPPKKRGPEMIQEKPRVCAQPQKWKVKKAPIKLLDAPGVEDDYYSSLISQNGQDVLAVALQEKCYIFDEGIKATLVNGSQIKSVSWNSTGSYVALSANAYTKGIVKIWDVETTSLVAARSIRRRLEDPSDGSSIPTEWESPFVFLGGYQTRLRRFDLRARRGMDLSATPTRLCNVKMSSSDSNHILVGVDGGVLLFDARIFREGALPISSYPYAGDIKSIAWNPKNRNQFAVGGGSSDKKICIHDLTSPLIKEAAISQVCSLLWMKNETIVAGLGWGSSPTNRVLDGKNLATVADLDTPSRVGRVLGLSSYCDGSKFWSLGSTETLSLWEAPTGEVPSEKKFKDSFTIR